MVLLSAVFLNTLFHARDQAATRMDAIVRGTADGLALLLNIVALLIVQAAAIAMLWLLGGYPYIFTPGQFVYVVFLTLLTTILRFYIFALILYVILSWIAPGTYSPAAALLDSLCEPLLRPVRRVAPGVGCLRPGAGGGSATVRGLEIVAARLKPLAGMLTSSSLGRAIVTSRAATRTWSPARARAASPPSRLTTCGRRRPR